MRQWPKAQKTGVLVMRKKGNVQTGGFFFSNCIFLSPQGPLDAYRRQKEEDEGEKPLLLCTVAGSPPPPP